MTNTMTPSEIADRLGHAEVYEIDDNNHALGNLLLDAAATIRELEARETRALAVAEHHADESMVLKAKLKIATEALEKIGYTPAGESGMPLSMCVSASRKALARIEAS